MENTNHQRTRKIQIFLDEPTAHVIKAQAAADGQSMSAFIRQLCAEKANTANFWALAQSRHNNALLKGVANVQRAA
jgi:hypothetical protein